MTRQSRIFLLSQIADCFEREHMDTEAKVIRTAIYDIGILDEVKKERDAAMAERTCGDTISRQAAIDAIEEMQMPIMRSEFPEEQFVFKGMSEALNAIERLPYAQQEIMQDGTLVIDTDKYNEVKRVLVQHGTEGELFYSDVEPHWIPIFKAKDEDSDQWVTGFYFAYPETTYCFTEDYERHPVKIIHCITFHRMTDWSLPNRPTVCNIDIDTLELVGWVDSKRETFGNEPWIVPEPWRGEEHGQDD